MNTDKRALLDVISSLLDFNVKATTRLDEVDSLELADLEIQLGKRTDTNLETLFKESETFGDLVEAILKV